MICILVALESELSSTLPELEGYTVIYTGVGKVNATLRATEVALRDDCEMIINYGTAGALQKDLVGKLSEIGIVRQRDMDARPLSELGITPFETSDWAGDIDLSAGDNCIEPNGITLGSGDQFVMAPPELDSQLVDMEGYAIAKVAKTFGVKVAIVKYGSDFADESAADDWEQNVANGQALFLKWLAQNPDC